MADEDIGRVEARRMLRRLGIDNPMHPLVGVLARLDESRAERELAAAVERDGLDKLRKQ